MKLGLIGLPASGKTTVFNALTGSHQPTGEFLNIPGIVSGSALVRDERLEWLRDKYQPKKYTPARFDCLDVTALVRGDGKKSEFDMKVLNDVRQCDALAFVLRAFETDAVPHPRGTVDPDRDFADAALEMQFSDLSTATNRIDKLDAQIKRFNRVEDKKELEMMKRIIAHLEAEKPLREFSLSDEERKQIRGFGFLTLKPWLKIYNVGEGQAGPADREDSMSFCAAIEMEIAQMDESDRAAFFADLGIDKPASERLAKLAYRTLGLISFFTSGPDEVRAWTISAGDNAVTAAGVIHSDLARGFIRAETTAYEDIHALGDEKAVKAANKRRLEGKDYIVADGDILNIRFSV